MFENHKLQKYLNKNQSLKYQMMVIIMEEHKKARQGQFHIGNYNGIDTISFDKSSWESMISRISDFISKGYQEKFKKIKIDNDIILGFFASENDYYSVRETVISEDVSYIEFTIKDLGYSYQYNGYSKSQDKLQKKANFFIFMTLIYYILSWFFEAPGISIVNIPENSISLVDILINIVKFFQLELKFIIITCILLFLFKVKYIKQ